MALLPGHSVDTMAILVRRSAAHVACQAKENEMVSNGKAYHRYRCLLKLQTAIYFHVSNVQRPPAST